MGTIYFELAPWSSMRLCLQLEETFPDLRGWRVELMKQLCSVAQDSEISDGVGVQGWLRTTVSWPQLQSECNIPDPGIFSEGSAERNVMKRIAEHCSTNTACETYWSDLQKLHRRLATRVKIHSNIIPREAYREKLNEELRRQQYGSRTSRREFYPVRVLADAVQNLTSVSEETEEWRSNGGKCVLTMHLNADNVLHGAPMDRLREVNQVEVSTITKLAESVHEVSWHNGIYVRKSFNWDSNQKFETERDVALRVCHPHVIRPIGQTFDVEGNPCLLMEWLGCNFQRFFIEQSDLNRSENFLFEGPVHSLDMLLQIARGLKSLHDAHVVHGDLNPQNIFFMHFEMLEDVRHFLVKIADFDHAQVVSSPEDFKPSPGTTRYAAPEVLEWTRLKVQDVPFCDPEKPEVDSLPYKLDIYGFGCIAHEVLTGQQVYDGYVFRKIIRRVVDGALTPDCSSKLFKWNKWRKMKRTYPRDLMRCLESCWALDPSQRPSSSELCRVLKNSMPEMQRRVTEIRNRKVAWMERRKYVLWNFLVPSLIAFICRFAASYIDAEKLWNWLENLAVVIAAVALLGFVCIYCHNYSGKLKRNQGC